MCLPLRDVELTSAADVDVDIKIVPWNHTLSPFSHVVPILFIFQLTIQPVWFNEVVLKGQLSRS